MNFDSLFLCFLHNLRHELSSFFVESRIRDFDISLDLEKSESNCSSYDDLVCDFKQVLKQRQLVMHLGSSHKYHKRTLWILQYFRKVIKLFLHKEACSLDLLIDSDHRAMCSVGCPECIIYKYFSHSKNNI